MSIRRAYSILEVKEARMEGKRRIFTGIASTPSVDRYGDIVEPKGMEIKLPAPLLWQHNSREPIGWVTSAKSNDDGILVECEVATIDKEGELQKEIDKRWDQLTNKLVRGLSIGFSPIEHTQIDGTWGYRFTKWELLELSCVTIPANADCSIEAIKSMDRELRIERGLLKRTPVVRLDAPPPRQPVKTVAVAERKKGVVYLD